MPTNTEYPYAVIQKRAVIRNSQLKYDINSILCTPLAILLNNSKFLSVKNQFPTVKMAMRRNTLCSILDIILYTLHDNWKKKLALQIA